MHIVFTDDLSASLSIARPDVSRSTALHAIIENPDGDERAHPPSVT